MSYSVCTAGGAKTQCRYRLRKPFAYYGRLASGRIKCFCHATKTIPKTARIVRSAHRCACAGVSCIGIVGDLVLFQPTVTSLSMHRRQLRPDQPDGVDFSFFVREDSDYRNHSRCH